jgi:uncharacterized protein DUF1844
MGSTIMAEDEPKIFIDEDWKAQVQREREQVDSEADDEAGEAATGADNAEDGLGPEDVAQSPFLALVTSLATQCMFALGVIHDPNEEQVRVDIGQAKILVDMLMALREKTQGNLTEQEEGHLTQAVAELQRIYVVRAQQVQEAELKNAGINPQDLQQPLQ